MTSTDSLLGTELGDFRPVALLGQGGMGAVYEAEDLALSRRVAVKVLLSRFAEDARARARFQREIEHAVAMEHPHVVPIYAAGYERPHFYLAMRLVPGPDLARIVRDDGPLDETRALRILGQVASALHAVHDKGLVHRDIKPHNVLLWGAGSAEEHAMLTDFGIAKALDDTQSITGVTALGTPAYMAPEVCLGQLATPACDQYSLGCMAYELLSGAPPFDGDAVTLREAHVEQEPRSLADVAPRTSPAVVEAIDVALAKDPRKRHGDVRQMVTAAQASDDAFRSSTEISNVMAGTDDPGQAAVRLSSEHGLSDEKVSQLTDLDRTEVVRLRRRQARRALVGRRRGEQN